MVVVQQVADRNWLGQYGGRLIVRNYLGQYGGGLVGSRQKLVRLVWWWSSRQQTETGQVILDVNQLLEIIQDSMVVVQQEEIGKVSVVVIQEVVDRKDSMMAVQQLVGCRNYSIQQVELSQLNMVFLLHQEITPQEPEEV